MKRKGLAITTLIIFVIMIFFVFIYQLITPLGQVNKLLVKEKVSQKNFFTVSNSLDAAKYGFLEPALKYSYYQACYDNLKKGGWKRVEESRKTKYQDMEFMPLAGKEDFLDSLEGEALKNLNIYTENGDGAYVFLTQFGVRLPLYDDVKIRQETGKAVIGAEGGKLKIEEKEPDETIRLEKVSRLEAEADDNCLQMHSAAREKEEKLKGMLEEAMKKEMIRWPVLGAKDAEHQTADDVFAKAAGEAGIEVTGIENGRLKMEEGLKGIRIPAGEGTEGLNTNYILLRNLIKADIKAKECEDRTCYNFIYQASVPVGVKIANKNDKDRLPVFNGKDVAFEALEISFAYTHEFGYERGPLIP
ncbi:MAG: hypothetical protein HYX24_01495 [Candidatus Aenigmarchaeota archaeon]|nr:hypothetical protein [Candidatus Aenigmarchaeota archaeon]